MIERVRKALNVGIIWRSIFHETFLHLFPVLLHFWKESIQIYFCRQNFCWLLTWAHKTGFSITNSIAKVLLFRFRNAKFSYWKVRSVMAVQQKQANYKVKRFNSGLALPIFSVTNLCNRKPAPSYWRELERKKKEKNQIEAFLHLKSKDMSRVQSYISKGSKRLQFVLDY